MCWRLTWYMGKRYHPCRGQWYQSYPFFWGRPFSIPVLQSDKCVVPAMSLVRYPEGLRSASFCSTRLSDEGT